MFQMTKTSKISKIYSVAHWAVRATLKLSIYQKLKATLKKNKEKRTSLVATRGTPTYSYFLLSMSLPLLHQSDQNNCQHTLHRKSDNFQTKNPYVRR